QDDPDGATPHGALLLSVHGLPGGPSPVAMPLLASHTWLPIVRQCYGMLVAAACQIVAVRPRCPCSWHVERFRPLMQEREILLIHAQPMPLSLRQLAHHIYSLQISKRHGHGRCGHPQGTGCFGNGDERCGLQSATAGEADPDVQTLPVEEV